MIIYVANLLWFKRIPHGFGYIVEKEIREQLPEIGNVGINMHAMYLDITFLQSVFFPFFLKLSPLFYFLLNINAYLWMIHMLLN